MKTNVYKTKIIAVLAKNHLMSIADIHKEIPEADHSTIFRNVQQLVSSGDLKQISVDVKTTLYERTDSHHDHFICNDCGTIDAINLDVSGFKSRSVCSIQDVIVRGVCVKCDK